MASGTVTLTIPEDGIFNFTTVDVAAGATLKFTPNEKNTPVIILATGDINIAGTVNVDGQNGTSSPPVGGRGGPGGFAGGTPGFNTIPPGAGQGPGGGRPDLGPTDAGWGAYQPVEEV